MIKVGITGSLASGKTTASEILSRKRGPLFSADSVVKQLYKKPFFLSLLRKKFQIKKKKKVKQSIKKILFDNKKNIKKLERLVHPLVRNKMREFTKKNNSKKLLFYEIPLLIESNLTKYFNLIIFVRAKKKVRLKRFKLKKGDEKLFNLLNSQQIYDKKKAKFCDYVVVNEKNLDILKKNLLDILERYE